VPLNIRSGTANFLGLRNEVGMRRSNVVGDHHIEANMRFRVPLEVITVDMPIPLRGSRTVVDRGSGGITARNLTKDGSGLSIALQDIPITGGRGEIESLAAAHGQELRWIARWKTVRSVWNQHTAKRTALSSVLVGSKIHLDLRSDNIVVVEHVRKQLVITLALMTDARAVGVIDGVATEEESRLVSRRRNIEMEVLIPVGELQLARKAKRIEITANSASVRLALGVLLGGGTLPVGTLLPRILLTRSIARHMVSSI